VLNVFSHVALASVFSLLAILLSQGSYCRTSLYVSCFKTPRSILFTSKNGGHSRGSAAAICKARNVTKQKGTRYAKQNFKLDQTAQMCILTSISGRLMLLKNSWLKACSAVYLFSGLNCSKWRSRSSASGCAARYIF
jgi:hypothetical protein